MPSKIKFENLYLIENRIILNFKSKKEEVILVSEIEKVYMKTNKISLIYYLLFVLSAMIIAVLSLIYLPFDIILLVPTLIIITGAIKLKNCKIYDLKIRLKDGRLFSQVVPQKLKYKTIEILNIIYKEIYVYKINN